MKFFHEREIELKRRGEVSGEPGEACSVDLVVMEVFLLCVLGVNDVVEEKSGRCLG